MNPPFLDPDGIQRSCTEAALTAEATQAFLDFAARVRADATLLAHAIATHHCFYETKDNYTPTVTQAEATFGDNAPALRALMVLDSIRLVREKQGMRGVPIDITRATLERHPCPTLREYFAQHGQIGADDWIWWWYRTVGSGDLYRLNRLEFIPEAWDYPWRVMVNDATSETIVLLNAGLGLPMRAICSAQRRGHRHCKKREMRSSAMSSRRTGLRFVRQCVSRAPSGVNSLALATAYLTCTFPAIRR